jgi:CheY-like chemotaxis protein
MALHDYDKANEIHAALQSLLLAEPGRTDNPEVLARASTLCDAAVDAVNDVESRVAIRGVKSLAALLYSNDGHKDIDAGSSLRGADAVRFQMMNGLSLFRARLKALEHVSPSRPEVPALGPRSLRVLIVEDNRDSAATLGKLLELSGYNVTVAHTAMEGLDAARRVAPDVVLCDIGLPDSDGFAVAEALRENPATASARLIALTAYGQNRDRERSRRAGFELHLLKPIDPGALLQFLEETPKPAASSLEARIIDMAAFKKPGGGSSGK